jgi:hypothetical protein
VIPGAARATALVLLLAAVVGPAASGSLLGAPASAAESSTPSLGVPALASSYVTNGPVNAIAHAGTNIYIGGQFDRVGPRTGPGVELRLDGSQDRTSPEVAGSGPTAAFGSGVAVRAVVADGAGGWFVGGLFTHLGSAPRTNLAHVLADHTVDPQFHPALDDAVATLALYRSTLYVGGGFTTVDGQARRHLAALSLPSGQLTGFDPAADAPVEALAVAGDGAVVYAGGRFTTIGGRPRLSLAALDATDGTAVPTFDMGVTGATGQGIVSALAVAGSTLYVGGTFITLGGQPRKNIGAVSLGVPLDGVAVPAFDPSATLGSCTGCGAVYALAVSSDTVYVGGWFDTIGGQRRNNLAAVRVDDGSATGFNPDANGNVRDVELRGSTLYVAGTFRSLSGAASLGGQPRNGAGAVDAVSGSGTSWNPNPNGIALAVAASATAVYLGGGFSSLGGVERKSLAALSATDGTVTDFNPGVVGAGGNSGIVSALVTSGSTLYVGGFFAGAGGQQRSNLAAVDLDRGTATPWNPAPNSSVSGLAVGDGVVYAGGTFTTVGGQSRPYLAALRLTDGTATSWDPRPNSEPVALLVDAPVLYVGGFFTTIGGQTRNKIAALRISDGVATDWDPDATDKGNVLALAKLGSTIYAGGNFSVMHGLQRRNLAALSAADGTPTPFDPAPYDATTGGGVMALTAQADTVYAAGFFTSVGGQPRSLLAGMRAGDGEVTSFAPDAAPGFGAFALDMAADGSLYAGGSFNTLDLGAQQGFARFRPDTNESEPIVPEGRPWLMMLAALTMVTITGWRRRARS